MSLSRLLVWLMALWAVLACWGAVALCSLNSVQDIGEVVTCFVLGHAYEVGGEQERFVWGQKVEPSHNADASSLNADHEFIHRVDLGCHGFNSTALPEFRYRFSQTKKEIS